ncbi:MAG: hypothetical protein ABI720_07890 [Actinomycetes bacterium]
MTQSGRLAFLTFVTVAIGMFAGFVVALMAALAVQDSSGDLGAVGYLATPLPGLGAAGGWAVVNHAATGRKFLAIVAVFFGSMAALIFLVPFGPVGLVVAMGVSGGFGVAARRLLDPHPEA